MGMFNGSMKVKKDQLLSPNFYLSEFNYVEPLPQLLYVLQSIRYKTGKSVVVTNSTRSIKQHIQIYKDLARVRGVEWYNIIPWSSRHLPGHGNRYLRAVDFACHKVDSSIQTGRHYTGDEIHEMVLECIMSDEFKSEFGEDICFGHGIGHHYYHLDSGDRSKNAEWRYDY